MSVEAEQVQQKLVSPQLVLSVSWVEELNRAFSCCLIGKTTSDVYERLRYFVVAEATSAKFIKLRSQGKIGESKAILELMSIVEEELGGRLYRTVTRAHLKNVISQQGISSGGLVASYTKQVGRTETAFACGAALPISTKSRFLSCSLFLKRSRLPEILGRFAANEFTRASNYGVL